MIRETVLTMLLSLSADLQNDVLKQEEAEFIAEVKSSSYCPCLQLTGDGMVKAYSHLIAAGRLTEQELRNACVMKIIRLN